MTCVAGVARGGHVCIGGDSSIAWDEESLDSCVEPKVFRRGEWLIGLAGDANADRAFHFELRPPQVTKPIRRLVAVDFADEVKRALETTGAGEADFSALIGVSGQLYVMGSTYEVARHRWGYAAVGSGAAWATGALAILTDGGSLTLQQTITEALDAAHRHCPGVRPPFAYVSA